MPAIDEPRFKINGQYVTKKQWDAHTKRRNAIYGDQLAEMLDAQKAPKPYTNDTVFAGKKNGVADMDEKTFQRYKRRADAAGVDITGKYYYGQLADYPGDPKGWCGSESEMIESAKRAKIKLTLPGNRVHDYRETLRDVPDDKPYAVAQDIVDAEVDYRESLEYEGRATSKQRQDLEETVRKELTPAHV